MEEYIKEIKKIIGITTDMFYQQNKVMGCKVLLLLLDKLAELITYIEKENGNNEYDSLVIDLNKIMNECLGALESMDIVLLADILQYDLTDILEGI